ncbi:signal peptidase I [Skermania piniformis]|uniref:Signal peptidase I n=1 Tax=Skermania pinensis TaxID=39122 RepID=A0ABX8S956_9ACTN|nr:signal peptidase I [Skermania piniformis]QXQ13100.1 signal peptidase I [Skermania piniformis]
MAVRRRLTVVVALVAVPTTVAFAAAAVLSVPVTGQSMAPTLNPGDRIIVRPIDGAAVERFDLVVARFTPTGPAVVKRVIGLPGDRVSVEDSSTAPVLVRVQPDGDDSWYAVQNPAWASHRQSSVGDCCRPDGRAGSRPQAELIPPGMLFVVGDNIDFSDDSRAHGWLPARLVDGRVVARVMPPGRLGGADRGVMLRPAS